MHVISVGLNHTTAPIHIRERAAVTVDALDDALQHLANLEQVKESAIVSTCNRTEVYCHLETPEPKVVTDWLCDYHALTPQDLSPFLYQHPNEQAVRHAFRVAAGLDSMVLGEPQILGQMKSAFASAHQSGASASRATLIS